MKALTKEALAARKRSSPLPTYLSYLAILAVAIVIPFVLPDGINLATEILVYALVAMSLDILIGYTGMISFGHAGFFAGGAYVTAWMISRAHAPLLLSMLIAVVVITALSLIVGALSIRAPGLGFAMLTLAFAQMFYAIAFKWRDVTGGSDGISGVRAGTIALGPVVVNLDNQRTYYYFAMLVLAVSFLICRRIVSSPLGKVLQAVRENEHRAEFIGYNVPRYKLISFVISALFAALAGTLFSPFMGFISPEMLFWTISGNILIMAIIGGVGTLLGPIFGAATMIFLQEYVSNFTQYWMLVVGILFIVFVIFVPGGMVGFVRDRLPNYERLGK